MTSPRGSRASWLAFAIAAPLAATAFLGSVAFAASNIPSAGTSTAAVAAPVPGTVAPQGSTATAAKANVSANKPPSTHAKTGASA
jgi:hypothetical protein